MMTPKKQLFVNFYMAAGETYQNATRAAIAAGFSAKTAKSAGSRLLSDVDVKAAIDELTTRLCTKLEISAEKVLAELAKLAFVNLQDFYEENGSLKEISTLPRDVAAALSSSKINLTEACAVQEIKLHDKKASLELLGRHLRLFTDKLEIEAGSGLAERLDAARRRVLAAKKGK